MSDHARQVLEEALRLARSERAELAATLLRSLDDVAFGPPDEDYDEAWSAEIQRRVQEIDEGKAKLVDGDQALADLRSKYRRK